MSCEYPRLLDISFTVSSLESEDADRFIRESNLNIIQQYVENNIDDPDEEVQDAILNENNSSLITGLGKHLYKKLFYILLSTLLYFYAYRSGYSIYDVRK